MEWRRYPTRLRAVTPPAYLLMAVGAAIVTVVGTAVASRHQHDVRPLDAGGYALLLAAPACLLVSRRWPTQVLAAVFALTFGYNWLGYPGGPIWLPLIVALLTAVITGHRLAAYVSLAAGFVSAVWLSPIIRDEPGSGVAGVLGISAWLLTLAVVSELVRYRRQLREASRREAAEARRSELEATRRRASEERLDIARELHDVLAHSISMINVQAGVALELMDERPEQARTALTTIKQASKDALVEVQAVLGALRQADEDAATAPAPSMTDIERLLAGARVAGLNVNLSVDGDVRPLPVGTDLAAFRILQESLTNVIRHAGATTVNVAVRYAPHELDLEVIDDGTGSPNGHGPGAGSGIAGMRERASALGGELTAGRRLGGGFRVCARLPLGGGAG